MAIKTVFVDDDNNELNCYVNDNGKVFIGIGQPGDDHHYCGYITLDKEDVAQLITRLSDCHKEMFD